MRILTGHNSLREQFFRIGALQEDMCPSCNVSYVSRIKRPIFGTDVFQFQRVTSHPDLH